MGLKGRNKGHSQTAGATTIVDPESEPFEMETADTEIESALETNTDAGANTDTNTDAKPRRGRKPGQSQERGPQLEWTDDRQRALVRILKSPKALGTIRTASSIADALAQDPAFRGETLLTPERVKSFMATAVRDWKKAQEDLPEEDRRPVPAYLTLDRARRVVVNLALFDVDDDAGAEAADDEETEDEAAA